MFKNTIQATPFVSAASNSFFNNIEGVSYYGDISFLSTLRALVAPRMSSNESLNLGFSRSSYSAEQVSKHPARTMLEVICESFTYNRKIYERYINIHSIGGSCQEDNYACMELAKSSFCDVFEGWYRLDKITDFYRKQFYVLCFINPDTKSVVVFVDNLDMKKMHYLQCSILAFLPWIFKPEQGISEDEMALISSLREKTPDKYMIAITKLAEQYDFRRESIKKMLSGFEARFEKEEYESVKHQIAEQIDTINELNREIGRYLTNKNILETKLFGLEKKIAEASADSEIMEYFLCNDKLSLVSVQGTRIIFAVKTYLTYFDEDMILSAINNKSSFVYHPQLGMDVGGIISPEDMEKLVRAIFIDQILKVKVCAAYEFNIYGNVEAQQHFDFDYNFNDCMPNPHIDIYRCIGNYSTTINQLLVSRDYISAIEQCVASSKSLNFGDSVVMQGFFSVLYGLSYNGYDYNNRCIELPDGNVVTPIDAIEWLNQ